MKVYSALKRTKIVMKGQRCHVVQEEINLRPCTR